MKLSRETLRHLDPQDSAQVAAGQVNRTHTGCASQKGCTSQPTINNRGCGCYFHAVDIEICTTYFV